MHHYHCWWSIHGAQDLQWNAIIIGGYFYLLNCDCSFDQGCGLCSCRCTKAQLVLAALEEIRMSIVTLISCLIFAYCFTIVVIVIVCMRYCHCLNFMHFFCVEKVDVFIKVMRNSQALLQTQYRRKTRFHISYRMKSSFESCF